MATSVAVKLPQIPGGSDYRSTENKYRHIDGVLSQKLNKYSSMAGGQAVVDYYKNTPLQDAEAARRSGNFSLLQTTDSKGKVESRLSHCTGGQASAQSQHVPAISDH